MARTLNMLAETFGRDLSSLINGYFAPRTSLVWDCGKAGAFEACLYCQGVGAEYVLRSACKRGYIEIAQLAIARGAILFERAARYAGKSNQRAIINMLDSIGIEDWSEALAGACAGGHAELVEVFTRRKIYNFEDALQTTCESDSIECLMVLARRGVNISHCLSLKHGPRIKKYLADNGIVMEEVD